MCVFYFLDETAATTFEKPADALPVKPCLNALAELRHAKWYQVRFCAFKLSDVHIIL